MSEVDKVVCENCNLGMEPDVSFKNKWVCRHCGLTATIFSHPSLNLIVYVEGVQQMSPEEAERLKAQNERWEKQQKKNREKTTKSFLKNSGGGTNDKTE